MQISIFQYEEYYFTGHGGYRFLVVAVWRGGGTAAEESSA
ncbi:hypothetical protein SALWKB12_0461 [Snodgrassella communis]|uniref:Uncharacterized protein n=1 Tax=Snodgrassella communis TaxID=2946699 RepID=A0A837AH16_9NEIS|nr:hypothetical protein SALWKB12_0461 [Snodgrassella communis]KDN15894.1 hypothetical protein SALWKB29_0313 [Snodgrassella communis]